MGHQPQGHSDAAPVVLFAGRVLAERPFDGWLDVENGRIRAHGKGEPEGAPDATGWIVPSPVNAHTHVADAALREVPGKPASVAELFGPGGWKHQQLAQLDQASQDAGTLALADSMANLGTSHFIDFREGGVKGVQWLRSLNLPVQPLILGRGKARFDERETDTLLELGDGLGISGLRDHKRADLEGWADACHDARKPFAIHVSEDKRDDIDAAIALEPAFVVHMTHAKTADLDALAQERIPIVVCPRSNARFGRLPPVPDMLELGCTVAVGTDNGMLQDGDLLAELQVLATAYPDIWRENLLTMLGAGRQLVGLQPARLSRGAPADWIVLPPDVLRAQASKPGFDVPTS